MILAATRSGDGIEQWGECVLDKYFLPNWDDRRVRV